MLFVILKQQFLDHTNKREKMSRRITGIAATVSNLTA